MEFPKTMDIFQHKYYRLNKVLLETIGQWPYQTARVRSVIVTVILAFASTHAIPQIMFFVNNLDNFDLIIECMPALIFCAFCTTKLLSSVLNSKKMLMLLNHIRRDWGEWALDGDGIILHDYAQKGRMITVGYTAMVYGTGFIFVFQPILPKIIDVLLKNGTARGQFPIPVDYCYFDMQKYYFYIILHSSVYALLGCVVTMTYDTIFMVYVQHSCGLFATVGRKLERIGKIEKSADEVTCSVKQSDMDFKHIASCIDHHNNAIEFADLLEETYSWCFLFIVGFNMLVISMEGIKICTRTIAPEESIRFIVCNVVSMVHLYGETYMAQSLMDHSIAIREYIFNGKWYTLPPKSQKLLVLMIMRCNVPCQITAGKIAVMSVESFGMVLKTSLEYFTLLRSL